MSIDYRDEINRLIQLQNLENQQKQQKKDIPSFSIKNYSSINNHNINNNNNIQSQFQTQNPSPNKVNFLLKGNEGSLELMKNDFGFKPKGNRPLTIVQQINKGHVITQQQQQDKQSFQDIRNDSQLKIKEQQQNINLLRKQNVSMNTTKLSSPIKNQYQSQNNYDNEQNYQTPIQKNQNISIIDQIQQSQLIKSSNNNNVISPFNNTSQNINYSNNNNLSYQNININQNDDEQQQQQYQNRKMRSQSQQEGNYNDKQQMNILLNDQIKQDYGSVEQKIIKGGGGGMIKGKKKYEYRFRDIHELVEQSENTAPFGMIDMRLTPRLYEKKMKLQTIHDHRNERLFSCEEDIIAKNEIQQVHKENKKRLQDQINVINRQQLEWEYIVSNKLERHKVIHNKINNNGNSFNKSDKKDYENNNKLFQPDLDKRIHNLYINEKLLKFTADTKNAQLAHNAHTFYLQKEKQRMRKQSNHIFNHKNSINLNSTIHNISDNNNSIDHKNNNNISHLTKSQNQNQNQQSLKFQDHLNLLSNNLTTHQSIHDEKTNPDQQINLNQPEFRDSYYNINNNQSQSNIPPDFMETKYNDIFKGQTTEQLLNNILMQQYKNQINNQCATPSPDESIHKLYTYYDQLDKNKDTINNINNSNKIGYCTTGDIIQTKGNNNNKESIEEYLQNEMTALQLQNQQQYGKLPQIDKTQNNPIQQIISKRQPIPFSLSEQKPKQQQQELSSPQKQYLSKKQSIDHHLFVRNKSYKQTRNVSPSPNYNNSNYHVNIDNSFQKRNYSLGSASSAAYKNQNIYKSKRGFLNQTFINC